MVARWAELEFWLTGLLRNILRQDSQINPDSTRDKAAIFVTERIDWKTALGLCRGLIWEFHNDDADSFDEISDKIQKIAITRNAIVHTFWSDVGDNNEMFGFNFKTLNRIGAVTHEYTPSDLISLSDEIYSIISSPKEFDYNLNYRP